MLTNQLPFNLQDMWIGLLHHVCNDHEWLGGRCTHHEGVHDENLPWFDRRDKDFVELQKVILNPELLRASNIIQDLGINCLNFKLSASTHFTWATI